MMTRERELLQQALDALDRAISDDRAYIRECKDAAEAIRAHLAAQPAPAEDFCYCDDDISLQMVSGGAALEGLYGRVTLKINGQYVDYVKAQPAPVPLTDTETHAELWKLAVRKGLITVRSELIDPRNHGTRVSWMQGHDKACDISNDAAAHGIAASPEQPK